MSDFAKCKTCGDYGWLSTHECPPKYMVKLKDEDDESAREVYGRDAERAAERFCEKFDSDYDHRIVENGEASFEVWLVANPETRLTVEIQSEMAPQYWASTKR